MELETAARRHLLAIPAVNGYVAGKVFKRTLLLSPEGTGGLAIVVRRQAGWAQPDSRKTSEFPRLVIECWADPDRNTAGDKSVENGDDKAWALFRVVDKALHGIRDQWWGAGGSDPGLRIITCARTAEPVAQGGPDASAERSAVFGDMSMVQAVYDVQTVH